MKIAIFLISFVCMLMSGAMAQTGASDIDKAELKSLLEERQAKFNSYSASLEKRSGIFGNKTKNDIKKSSEVLIDLVKADNRIISTLYRVDFRTYQKVNMYYDMQH